MYSVGRNSVKRSTRGVTLVEALSTTAFLGVALLALSRNTVSVTRVEKTADLTSAAQALATQKLEQLRSTPLGAAQVTYGTYYDPQNPLRGDGTSGGLFNRSWTVSAKDTPRFGLRTVVVTVSWYAAGYHNVRLPAFVRCATVPCPAP
jgi:Tfp pilus assembly protein PilV